MKSCVMQEKNPLVCHGQGGLFGRIFLSSAPLFEHATRVWDRLAGSPGSAAQINTIWRSVLAVPAALPAARGHVQRQRPPALWPFGCF
jgi:hypothetical protein